MILNIESTNLKRLQNYFSGAPWPFDYSNKEIDAALGCSSKLTLSEASNSCHHRRGQQCHRWIFRQAVAAAKARLAHDAVGQ